MTVPIVSFAFVAKDLPNCPRHATRRLFLAREEDFANEEECRSVEQTHSLEDNDTLEIQHSD